MTSGSDPNPTSAQNVRRVVVAECPGCQRPFAVPAKYAGRRVACPKCHTGVDVPTGAEELTAVACSSCGHQFAVPGELTGRKVRCPQCSTTQEFGAAEASEVLSEAAAPAGSKSGGASSGSSNPVVRRLRRFVHCPNCHNVFPVLVEKPANDYSCPKCNHRFLDGHCVRQDELSGAWFHHTSMFGGVKYGPYDSRAAATAALLEAMQKRR